MKKTVKRRTAVILVSYMSAAIIVLGILAGTNYQRAENYKNVITANYQHAFGELVTALGEMDTALQKSVYASSPSMIGAVCTEIFGKAMTAQMSMGVLPFSTSELERTAGFISRTGDYAFALARSAPASGYTDEQLKNLRSLSDTASLLSVNMQALQTDLLDGVLTMDELEASEDRLDELEGQALPSTVGDSMRLIEQEFPEAPSLIYDGPFSEHIVNAQPKLLEGLSDVSEDEARRAASQFTDISEGRLYLSGTCDGSLPCYYFSSDSAGNTVSVAVTKKGGVVLGMLSSREVSDSRISAQEASDIAIRFLNSRGYRNMAKTYYIEQDGVVTVNFAFKQGGVLCYSDLIKVSVATDTGAVCNFEAMGYIMSHSQRDMPQALINEQDAVIASAPGLKVLSTQLALVPSDGKYEALCYELKCEDEQQRHFLIYVNAQTGNQEKILILLEDETGTLTI